MLCHAIQFIIDYCENWSIEYLLINPIFPSFSDTVASRSITFYKYNIPLWYVTPVRLWSINSKTDRFISKSLVSSHFIEFSYSFYSNFLGIWLFSFKLSCYFIFWVLSLCIGTIVLLQGTITEDCRFSWTFGILILCEWRHVNFPFMFIGVQYIR